MRRLVLPLAALVPLVLAACGGGVPGPPAGWTSDDAGRWWREGADTTGAFRSLETFEAMGVPLHDDGPYVAEVQRELEALFRTEPRLVDSAFVSHVIPLLARTEPAGADERARLAGMERAAYREISRYYRQAIEMPGPREAPAYPDSLRERGVGGTVAVQVRVSAAGEPLTVETVERVHPTLDALVMRSATERRWNPAGFRGEPVPSWARLQTTFATQ